jgi:hypothetical protein
VRIAAKKADLYSWPRNEIIGDCDRFETNLEGGTQEIHMETRTISIAPY